MSESVQYRITATSAAGLVQAVESAIADGALEPGQQLPSVRSLATETGISPATVAAGLAELRRRGLIVTEPRRGSRIGEGPPIAVGSAAPPLPAGVTDLTQGNPDARLLPDLTAALRRANPPQRLYGEPGMLPGLLAPARERFEHDGVPARHLCVTSGALDAIERVLAAHLRPGDRVAVEDPGYAAMFDLLRAQGLAIEPVAIDERGMRPQALQGALARGAAAVVVTPRGQNPTGAAFDAERAAGLVEVLEERPRVLVIEDDHLGPIAGVELHTILAGRQRWASTRSVAKSLGPDLRLALLSGDEQTIARVQGRQRCGPGWVSHILQALVVELWGDAQVAAAIVRADRIYSQRRAALLEALERAGLTATGRSGMNVWVEVPDESAAVAGLLTRGWAVAGGARYRLRSAQPAIRITIATLPEAQAERLASDLAGVVGAGGAERSA